MNQRGIEQVNLIRNIATLMVADTDEELSRVHMDEAESEIETIERLRDKAQAIVCAADILLEQREG